MQQAEAWLRRLVVGAAAVGIVVFGAGVAIGAPTFLQDPPASPPASTTDSSQASPQALSPELDEAEPQPAEPDFRVVNLPTTLGLPLRGMNFGLTHRFAGNLRQGGFQNQLENLFGLDQGATIGLEFRYGIAHHLQAVVYRTNFDKTIQFYGKWDAVHQNSSRPVSISGLLSVEGSNNFRIRRQPALGAVLGRTLQDRVAVYATPLWVHDSASEAGLDRDTFVLGLAGRVRLSRSVYVVGEVSPRLAGYAPGQPEYGFGIEKRVGGHVFQLNVANTFGSTFAQTARGGFADTLYLGFNLGRKFY